MSRANAQPQATDDVEQHDDALNEGLRKRLEFVAQRHSQADIARKARTSRTNVNRYLKGNRIPGDFCAALALELDVNPIWLLTGEGAPYMADISAGTAARASDLLELVQAMNNVARMKLGALAGKSEQKTLRELSDAIRSYQELRGKLNEQFLPLYKKLVHDFDKHVNMGDTEEAEYARKAAEQVASICDDTDTRLDYLAAMSGRELYRGNAAQAVEMHKQIFYHRFFDIAQYAQDPVAFEGKLIDGLNYLKLLRSAGRHKEALRICRAFQPMVPRTAHAAWHYYLHFLEGELLVDLGMIHRGWEKIAASYPRLDPDVRKTSRYVVSRVMVLNGMMTPGEAVGADAVELKSMDRRQHISLAPTMLGICCATEDPLLIAQGLKLYSPLFSQGKSFGAPYLVEHARHLLEALERRSGDVHRRFVELESVRQARERHGSRNWIYASQMYCQIARVCGDRKEAVNTTIEIDKNLIRKKAASGSGSMVVRFNHYRNVLALWPNDAGNSRSGDMRARALHFFEEAKRRGYVWFGVLLEQHMKPTACG